MQFLKAEDFSPVRVFFNGFKKNGHDKRKRLPRDGKDFRSDLMLIDFTDTV